LLQLKLKAKSPGTKFNLPRLNVLKQTDSITLICFGLGLSNYLANTIHSLHYSASYDLRPGNGVGLFWHYVLTYLLSPDSHGDVREGNNGEERLEKNGKGKGRG